MDREHNLKDQEMVEAFLGLGSNLGDRYGYLRAAIDSLRLLSGIEVIGESEIYETKAVGFTEQPDFLNMAARIRTNLMPEELLAVCLGIEKQFGRIRQQKWGPRTLDIDILFYGRLVLRNSKLMVPHPRMHERAFVVLPLRDLAPEWVHPVLGVAIQEIVEQVPGKEGVQQWERPLENG